MPYVTDPTPDPRALTRAQRRLATLQANGPTDEPLITPGSDPSRGSDESPGSDTTPGPDAVPDSPAKSEQHPAAERKTKPKSLGLTRAQKRAVAAEEAAVDPIPEMPLQPLVTIAVVCLAALMTISAFAGPALVAISVALAAGVMAWGWSGLLGLPSPRGTALVLAIGSIAAIGTVLATRTDPYLAWMPAALAGSVIIAFLHQLARRDGRPRLVESVGSSVTAIAIVVSGASFVALPRTPDGPWLVALAASAMAVSALTDMVGGSARLRAWLLPLAMLAGGVAAIIVGVTIASIGWGPSALIGVLAAGISHAIRRALAMLPTISGPRSQLVSASASVLISGVVVYVVGRFFLG
jgi:hypothetical protein